MISKALKYNIFHFPNDLTKFVQSHSFLMLSLGLLYYGGGAIMVYSAINVQFPWSVAIWLASAFISMFLVTKFPGLFYLDNVSSRDHTISLLILGPINFLRAACLAIIFVNQIKKTYPYTLHQLWKTHPEAWSLDDPWIKAIQRSREIGISTLAGDIRRMLYIIGKSLWKIARIKISERMLLQSLFVVLGIIVLFFVAATLWLGIIGKL